MENNKCKICMEETNKYPQICDECADLEKLMFNATETEIHDLKGLTIKDKLEIEQTTENEKETKGNN